jgi:anthranilate synthase/aminodeoxychorismate synthase-like glutamine amidotransferase
MIVVLDNRDSFVFNLARLIHLLGVEARVVPAHGTTVADLERLAPRGLVISPGPCTPAEAGCSVDAVRAFRGIVPILGVCLGHQAIAAALGGRVVRAREPVHGRTSQVHHDGLDLFAGIPSPFAAGRYHSLVVEADSLPDGLVVTARDAEGTVMAIAAERHAVYGVQFHPESILTRHGFRLLANFLGRAGLPHHAALVPALDDDVAAQAAADGAAGTEPLDTEATGGRVVTF